MSQPEPMERKKAQVKFRLLLVDFATSAEMIRQAMRWMETLRLDEK
jgi:hypothetical protein